MEKGSSSQCKQGPSKTQYTSAQSLSLLPTQFYPEIFPKAAAGRDFGGSLHYPFSAWTMFFVLPERKIKDMNPPPFAISNPDPGQYSERPCEVRYIVRGDM